MPGAILRDLWLSQCFRAWITYLGPTTGNEWARITGGADYRGSLIIAPTHPPLTPLANFYLHKFRGKQLPPCHELAIRDHPPSVSVCLQIEGVAPLYGHFCPRLPEEESKLLYWFFFRKIKSKQIISKLYPTVAAWIGNKRPPSSVSVAWNRGGCTSWVLMTQA